MELFNETLLDIDGVQITSRKLVGYTMGVPYLMEPLKIAKLVKNENILYRVFEKVEVLIEMVEMIHDFIERGSIIYLITCKGLYKYENLKLQLLVADYMVEFINDTVISDCGSVYDIDGKCVLQGNQVYIESHKIANLELSTDLILDEFEKYPLEIKLGIRELLFKEYHVKEWIDIEEFYPKDKQRVELTQMKFDPNKLTLANLNIQSSRIYDKQVKRGEALREIDKLKGLKPRREHSESQNEKREQMGVLNHIERYSTSKTLYHDIFKLVETPKLKLITTLLSMDIDHFHTFATLNKASLQEYVLVDHEVKALAIQLEESREDLKRVKAEFKKKTIENQDYLDQQKRRYNLIKSVYSDRVKYKEQVLGDLNVLYEAYMNDIPQWTMSLIGFANEIVNTESNVENKRFYILSQKLYKEMLDLLQNQKTKHEDTRSQKFLLQREFNVKQSGKKVIENDIVQLKKDIKSEILNKFGKEITLEEAERVVLDFIETPIPVALPVDPKLAKLDRELARLQEDDEKMLMEETKLNYEIHSMNTSYLNSMKSVPAAMKDHKSLDIEIDEYVKLNNQISMTIKELEIDTEILTLYPSKANHYRCKWEQNEN